MRLLYDAQNPAPVDVSGSSYYQRIQQIKGLILKTFMGTLPSNYVSQVVGPNYTTQFQVVAEQLATLQVLANEVYENLDFDLTRPEFLYQTLGSLVFPDSDLGIPDVDGDVTYRDFLATMVELLLKGSTLPSMAESVQLLTRGITRVNELYDDPGARIEQQFAFTVDVLQYRGTTLNEGHVHTVVVDANGNGIAVLPVGPDGEPVDDHEHIITGFVLSPGGDPAHVHTLLASFPEDPMGYQDSLAKVMRALKPAHTLYQLRFLFQETFRRVVRDSGEYETGESFDEEWVVDLDTYHYEDTRWYWEGAEKIVSTGSVGSDRSVVVDNTLSFRSVRPGAPLRILTGPNAGVYEVKSVYSLPFPNDPTPRPYTTTAFSGTATTVNGRISDPLHDFGVLPRGSTITFTSGPNVGSYRIYAITGNTGGPLGSSSGSEILLDFTRLRLTTRLPIGSAVFEYEVGIDTRGRSRPRETTEDVSSQFWL